MLPLAPGASVKDVIQAGSGSGRFIEEEADQANANANANRKMLNYGIQCD